MRAQAVELARQHVAMPLPRAGSALVVDARIRDGTKEEVWIDNSMFHPTSKCRIDKQTKWHQRRTEQGIEARDRGLPVTHAPESSPAMRTRVADKHDKYAPLLHLAQVQALRKERPCTPKFLAPVLSHSGEMSGDAFELVEWMTKRMKRAARVGGPRHSGRPVMRVAAEYRERLKVGLQVIAAREIGSIIMNAGYFQSR